MQRYFRLKRDHYAGALMVLLGLVAAQDTRHYPVGTLYHMGPGYFPLALGILLIVLGVLIAATAATRAAGEGVTFNWRLQLRGWACIIAGPILFMISGEFGGLIPATFACVFVSALGDRETTLKGATVLSLGITLFGVLLFSYLLQVPIPILKWD